MIIRDVAFAIAQFHGEKPETLHQSDVLQSIAEGNEARRQVAEKDALIASQAAEIAALKAALKDANAEIGQQWDELKKLRCESGRHMYRLVKQNGDRLEDCEYCCEDCGNDDPEGSLRRES